MLQSSDTLGSMDLLSLLGLAKTNDGEDDHAVETTLKYATSCCSEEKNDDGLSESDVICGKGKLVHSHPGNKNFRNLIQFRRQSYQKACLRDDKKRITNYVIAAIHETGGRFVKLENATGRYIEVSEEYSYEKVSHALRAAKSSSSPKSHSRNSSFDSSAVPLPPPPPPPQLKGDMAVEIDYHDLKRQQVSLLQTIHGEHNALTAEPTPMLPDTAISESSKADLFEPMNSFNTDPIPLDESSLALSQPKLEPVHSLEYIYIPNRQQPEEESFLQSVTEEDEDALAPENFEHLVEPINDFTATEPIALDNDVLDVLLQL